MMVDMKDQYPPMTLVEDQPPVLAILHLMLPQKRTEQMRIMITEIIAVAIRRVTIEE